LHPIRAKALVIDLHLPPSNIIAVRTGELFRLASATQEETAMSGAQKIIAGCLACLGLSLLVVGIVSGTLIRHIVQVLPVLIAFTAVVKRPDWGVYTAIPIFIFWLFIMILIWLFLFGIAKTVTGHFTATEIILTIIIGLAAVSGLMISIKYRPIAGFVINATVFVLSAALQIAAMWLSLQKPFVDR
jgi:hypothetical protein